MIELNFTPFPQLATERLLLRSLQSTDANEIFALRSDDNINKYLDRPKANTIEDAKQFIEKIIKGVANNESIYWVIALKETNEFAGTICMWNMDKEKNEAEIGYELLPKYHGKGIMQQAIEKVLAFGFEEMKLDSIAAGVHKDNIASIKILKRNDFVLQTEIENDMMEYKLSVNNFINKR